LGLVGLPTNQMSGKAMADVRMYIG
jgi:hypothetical protein